VEFTFSLLRDSPSKYRVATCGTDCFVRIWQAVFSVGEATEKEEPELSFRATLARHTKAVNVVRFSPDGSVLASAGLEAVLKGYTTVRQTMLRSKY
jgi:WD40 repeat protein